jgi:hypothetical protein
MIDLQLKASAKQLRVFGAGALILFGGLGWWLHANGHPTWAIVCWVIAGFSGLAAAAFPKANLPLYAALTLLAFPIGVALSYVMLGVMWYLVITIVALIFRLLGKDPLQRKWDRSAASYWQDYPATADRERYFRQF